MNTEGIKLAGVPVSSPTGVGFWGSFESSESEEQFRRSRLTTDARRVRNVILAFQLSAAFIYNDYQILRATPLFWGLLATRIAFLGSSAMACVQLGRPLSPRRFDVIVLSWLTMLAFVTIGVAYTRPPGFAGILIVVTAVVFAIYTIFPLLPGFQLLVAGLFSLWAVGSMALRVPSSEVPALLSFTVTLIIVNIIGWMRAHQLNGWKREQYQSLNRETEARNDVERALAEVESVQRVLIQTLLHEEKVRADLTRALKEVKTLQQIVPICSHCRRMRNDAGYWRQVEDYVRDVTKAEFSHSICPDCRREHYESYFPDPPAPEGQVDGDPVSPK